MGHDHDHSAPSVHAIVPGFGADRAAHYDAQVQIALAGWQAVYELGVSALASRLDGQEAASLLFVGLGTGAELMPYKQFEVPGWSFTGVDPSEAMLAVARERLAAEGLLSRTRLHVGELRTLPAGPLFDGAQMPGVLHHVAEEADRLALLRELPRRLSRRPEADTTSLPAAVSWDRATRQPSRHGKRIDQATPARLPSAAGYEHRSGPSVHHERDAFDARLGVSVARRRVEPAGAAPSASWPRQRRAPAPRHAPSPPAHAGRRGTWTRSTCARARRAARARRRVAQGISALQSTAAKPPGTHTRALTLSRVRTGCRSSEQPRRRHRTAARTAR